MKGQAMKKYLAAVLFSAAASVFAGVDYDLDSVKEWNNPKNLTQLGDNIIVDGPVRIESKKIFDIDPAKVYKLELKAKNIGKTPVTVSFGFALYNAAGKRGIVCEHVQPVPGTFCKLAKSVKKGDTEIFLDKDAAKWSTKKGLCIAIRAKADLADLPNFNIIYRSAKSIEKSPDGFKVTLNKPMTRALAAGTAIRQHVVGGHMYTAGVRRLAAGKVIEMEGYASGVHDGTGLEKNKWSKYAGKARVILVIRGAKSSKVEIDDIELEIDDRK